MDFTLIRYWDTIAALLGRGYTIAGYGDADPAARHLILRHDLDMSIQAAVPMAEIEAERGVKAHYFVLLRTEMYNPWSKAARRDLGRIGALGHELGLHFDASLHPDDDGALDRAAAAECDALAEGIGRPVRTISFHRPVRRLQGRPGAVGGRRHAYEPRFFTEMGYCSDSRGGWHHGTPLDHPAVAKGRALQLLTHPIWWNGPSATPTQRLHQFLDERSRFLDRELARHCDIHTPRDPGKDLNDE